jgi:hypothetical protein
VSTVGKNAEPSGMMFSDSNFVKSTNMENAEKVAGSKCPLWHWGFHESLMFSLARSMLRRSLPSG